MLRLALFAFLLLLPDASSAQSIRAHAAEDIAQAFMESGIDGTFVLRHVASGRENVHDSTRAAQRFVPASTFKVANALIALQTGALHDEHEVMEWDGVDRGWEAWNRDHDLSSAMSVSAVWFYQRVARRIGLAQMRQYLKLLEYGNEDPGDVVDEFWLRGPLAISPFEQVDFLERLALGRLPIREDVMETVREAIVLERGDGFVLRAKTGWARGNPDIGWQVGYLQRSDDLYVFALNFDIRTDTDASARTNLVPDILRRMNLLPHDTGEH